MTKLKHLSSTRLLRRVTAVMLLLCAVAIGGFAQSGGSKNSNKATKYVATKEIIFDKGTHQLRKPTAQEIDAMVAQISTITNRSSEGLKAKTLPNGTKQVNLQGRFGSVLLGRANADGTTEVRCVTSTSEALEFLGLQVQ